MRNFFCSISFFYAFISIYGLPTISGSVLDPTGNVDLEIGFSNPPASARPWSYWMHLNGNLSREGITADLESMARVGIGGALFLEVDAGAPKGEVDFAGPKWLELFNHACNEASRLRLEISMNNDAGWCGSGGPWITPELSMQKIVSSEMRVDGGTKIDLLLPQPPAVQEFYREIAVLAMPAPAAEDLATLGVSITTSGTIIKPSEFKLPKPAKQKPSYIQFGFPAPVTVHGLSASLKESNTRKQGKIGAELQLSDDGKNFKMVQSVSEYPPLLAINCLPVTARFFRLAITHVDDPAQHHVEIANVNFSCRISGLAGKALFKTGIPNIVNPSLPATFALAPSETMIFRDRIVELSGKSSWDAPPGQWLIIRFGHTTTGKTNHPAPESGCGLECDKLSKAASRAHFNAFVAKLVPGNQALISTHIDSWEVGSQNWTVQMREEFQARRGYDLLPFLPVFTGRLVESMEVSERFLWDFRQTVSDMMIENYAGEMRRLANQQGLRLSIEAYGKVAADEMKYAGQADMPMGEFWSWYKGYNKDVYCTEMASAAHIYGKNIVAAEAFTADSEERWLGHPANLKGMGDWAYCEGINHFVFHRFAAQPWTHVAPGMAMGPWGLHYERTQTWWEYSKPWHDYLARCQYLLRQGLFVADVLYLQPEGTPRRFIAPDEVWVEPGNRAIRGGYNFDGCTSDVILTRLTVKDGRLVLPDGMSYRVLVLPPAETMTLPLLRKIKELAESGATIIAAANPPQKSPSLAEMGEGDAELRKIAAELWPKLVTNQTAAQLLNKRGVKPDFSATPHLRYLHRATAGAEIYFVANREERGVDATATFRVTGKQPEFWWPDTGRIEAATAFEIKDGCTTVPMRLEPSGSVFVLFRHAAKAPKADGKNWIETTAVQEIASPWLVTFDPRWGGPAQAVRFEKLHDWSRHGDSRIHYYSGAATYRTSFQAKIADPKVRRFLDLGKVAVIAEVTLNGKPLGILWKPPYQVEVSEALKDGENRLEIKTVNLWINRQIGDEQMPEDSERYSAGHLKAGWPQWLLEGKPSPAGRYTFSSWKLWKKNDPLVESGLIGPVRLTVAP